MVFVIDDNDEYADEVDVDDDNDDCKVLLAAITFICLLAVVRTYVRVGFELDIKYG